MSSLGPILNRRSRPPSRPKSTSRCRRAVRSRSPSTGKQWLSPMSDPSPQQEGRKMGTLENGGKAAVGIIEAFKSSPMLLAILLTNVMLLIFVFYTEGQHQKRSDTVAKLF